VNCGPSGSARRRLGRLNSGAGWSGQCKVVSSTGCKTPPNVALTRPIRFSGRKGINSSWQWLAGRDFRNRRRFAARFFWPDRLHRQRRESGRIETGVTGRSGGTGRRNGLKIRRGSLLVWVRPPPSAPATPFSTDSPVLSGDDTRGRMIWFPRSGKDRTATPLRCILAI
jgi:hypothetical protein